MAALATRLIAANGRLCTFNTLGPAVDSTKPWRADSPSILASVDQKAAFVSLSARHLGIETIAKELLERTDEMLIVAPNATFDFLSSHQVVDATQTYSIVWCQVVKPADQAVFFAMGLSR